VDLKDRVDQVRERIDRAAARAGRRPSDITLIAVSKLFPFSAIREAYALGLRDFGENYVQEFEQKFPCLGDLVEARFHMIGHIQSNKAKRAAELFHTIETVDSEKLAQRLNAAGKPLEVMIEVKLSEEDSKSGANLAQAGALQEAIARLPNLRLTGLMTMPPWSDDPEQSRPYFRQLRELAARLRLPCLSMGMSHDLEVAIEEGATHVRVGTALFGQRKHP